MGVRRTPKNTFMGVHWTQWPWPSMVSRAIFRYFVPRPADANSEYRRTMYHRLSLGYLLVAWVTFGAALYYFNSADPTDTKKKSHPNIDLSINKYKMDDHLAKNFYSTRLRGFSVVESRDITEEVREGQRKKAEQ